MPPPQKVPHCIVDIFVNRLVGLAPRSLAKVGSPASQDLIQPLAYLFPWSYVARRQMVSHFRLDPAHALVRRTVSDVLPARPHTVVRPECIPQKIESLSARVPDTRLLLVESQSQSLQHPTRPLQCLLRLSATEDYEVIGVVHHLRPILLSTPGLPEALNIRFMYKLASA